MFGLFSKQMLAESYWPVKRLLNNNYICNRKFTNNLWALPFSSQKTYEF